MKHDRRQIRMPFPETGFCLLLQDAEPDREPAPEAPPPVDERQVELWTQGEPGDEP